MFSPTQVLDGRGSSPAARLSYRWSGNPTGVVGNQPTLAVSIPQAYQLLVRDTINGCEDSLTLNVVGDLARPVADAGQDTSVLNCYQPSLNIGGGATSQGPSMRYTWTRFGLPDDTLGRGRQLPVVAPAGIFVLSVLNSRNGCISRDTHWVLLQLDTPFVRIATPPLFGCFIDSVPLDASATFLGFDYRLTWEGPCLPSNRDRIQLAVDCPGTYQLEVFNRDNGCRSNNAVAVGLENNALVARLPDSVFLDCNSGAATIDRSLSTPAVRTTWLRDGQEVFLPGLNPVVTVPGTYTLILSNIDSSCVDTAQTVVAANCPLLAIIVPPDSLTCNRTQVLLDARPSIPVAGMFTEWIIPSAICAVQGPTERQLLVACPGRYGFVVTNPQDGRRDTAFVEVVQDLRPPLVEAGADDTITCRHPVVALSAQLSEQGERMRYLWFDVNGDTLSINQSAMTSEPGIYLLRVTNQETGCNATDGVTVFRNISVPSLSVTDAFLPCRADSFPISVLPSPEAGDFTYAWSGPLIRSGGSQPTVRVGRAGNYTATVTNQANGCSAQATALAEQLPCPPCLLLADTVLTCQADTVWLDLEFCEPCQGCTFTWLQDGQELGGATDTLLPVTAAGVYTVRAVNVFGLRSELSLRVLDWRVLPPNPAGTPQALTCVSQNVTLGTTVIDTFFGFRYQWFDPSAAPIPGANASQITVSSIGNYVLQVFNPRSGCRSSDSVAVVFDTLAPLAEAGPDRLLDCDNPLAVLDALGSSTGSTFAYRWAGGPAAPCLEGVNTLNPIVACGGTYVLTVSNRLNGCLAQDTVRVLAADALPHILPLADTVLDCRNPQVSLNAAQFDSTFQSRWCVLGVF
ncbi:MAG: hypothetical protein HC821_03440, partial [Lewinella sp.]|nr:hypothetical protein [Lewinella sp.]